MKDELISLVEGLDKGTEFNVIMFGEGGCDTFEPRAVLASDAHVVALKEWLAPYMRDRAGMRQVNYRESYVRGVQGTTRLDVALTAALKMRAETLFILTDGTPSVLRAPDKDFLQKLEEYKLRHKDDSLKYDAQLKDYFAKFPDEVEQAKQKAAEKNSSLSGRTRESYNWTQFAPHYPPPPGPFSDLPKDSKQGVNAEDFNQMIKDIYKEIYEPARMSMPTVNIIGYYVNEASEDYLKKLMRDIPGTFRKFKK